MENFLFEPLHLEHRVNVSMPELRSYPIRLVMQNRLAKPGDYEPNPHGATLAFQEAIVNEEGIAQAVSIAADSDVSIVYVGRNGEYESEGFDMTKIALPEPQISLIKHVAAASKRTVVILYCGNPIDVTDFVDDVDSIINAHFPGQEGGQALTDILTGKVNPSGRLATSWPKRLDREHVPSFDSFRARLDNDQGYTIDYTEGIEVGYRAPTSAETSRWPFGFGLSYTTFNYSDLSVISEDGKVFVSLKVRNSGPVAGHEVIQVYVIPPSTASVWRPKRELKGFTKIWALPDQSVDVRVELDTKHAGSFWDESICQWHLESGTYGIIVGDLGDSFKVERELTWNGR